MEIARQHERRSKAVMTFWVNDKDTHEYVGSFGVDAKMSINDLNNAFNKFCEENSVVCNKVYYSYHGVA